MPNVLVVTSLFPNKAEPELGSFIKKRMLAYSKRKNSKVVVVAPIPYFPPFRTFERYYYFSQIPRREIIDGMTVYHPRYPLIPKISMLFHGMLIFFSCISLIKKIQRKFSFDIIDAHFIYPDCFAAVLLGKFFSKPIVVSARGSDINEFSKFSLIKPLIMRTLAQSNQIISVCDALKNMMVDMGIESQKINVIPNGIDAGKFYTIDKIKAKQKLRLNNNDSLVLSVGALIPRKGHHITIEAVSLLKAKYPNLKLLIAGKGPMKEKLNNLAEELGVSNRVVFLGQIPNDELIYWYNPSDLFCLSSSREGWANVLTEAIACGIPAVATNVFGAPEIITQGKNGFLVNRCAEDVAKGIEAVLIQDWDKDTIAWNGSRRTWKVVAEEVSDVFDRVLSI